MGCLQATAGADIVMLDNRSPGELADMAKALKTEFPSLIIEGSGVSATCARAAFVVRSYCPPFHGVVQGITPATIAEHFSPYIDVLSMGKLTQGMR